MESLTLFNDFLEEFDLKNTKEIFLAESNFINDEKVQKNLKKRFSSENEFYGKSLLKQF